MMHAITKQTELLVGELAGLAHDVDAGLIDAASNDARGEWWVFRGHWPSAAELDRGLVTLTDEELALLVEKARRFKTILERLAHAS